MIGATSTPAPSRLPKGLGRCPRCGVVRSVKVGRQTAMCADCRSVLTPDERARWAA